MGDNSRFDIEKAEWLVDGGDRYAMSKQYLYEIGVSINCRKGNNRDGANQDNYFIYVDQMSKIIILTDGHGIFA